MLRVTHALRVGVRHSSTKPAHPGKLFDKILIANRGEISCRISRTAHKLGIKTVAIYSDPDINGIHVAAADEAVCVGPARSALSYLSIPKVIAAIEKTGAQAVHPGYGFLSENSAFVAELEKRGIVFIGPKASAMEALGDKINSKNLAIKAGVNTVPGYLADLVDAEEAVRVSRDIGYPVMIKASSGGGGKGMRVCYTDDEVRLGYRLSKQEAKAAFASDVVFVEKFIEEPRHIEIQLIADNFGNVVSLPERDCTIQRRNQKVIEESPSPFLDEVTRGAMQEQAAALARSVGYNSAGTVEFLVDKHRNFYFLEMNTRLQVEHPVTEAVTGLDLVDLMIRSAANQPLPDSLLKAKLPILGHAFEARVYAEDPFRGFLPSTGRLSSYTEPQTFAARDPYLGDEIRADAGVNEGSEISMFYDPMICKLITHGQTRESALDRLRAALDAYVIRGVNHNVSFLRDLTDHPRFKSGVINTSFIAKEYPRGFEGVKLGSEQTHQLVTVAAIMNAIKLYASFEIAGRYEHSVGPQVNHVFVSLGRKVSTTVDGKTDLVLPRVFEVTLRMDADDSPDAFNSAQEDVPQGDGNRWISDVREVDPRTNEPLHGAAGEMRHVSLGSVDWSADTSLLLAQLNGVPEGASRSRRVLRVQQVERLADGFRLQMAGATQDVFIRTPEAQALSRHMLPTVIRDMGRVLVSPMPGALISLAVSEGDVVEQGQECAVVEAMKMQNVLRAPKKGKVKSIKAKAGATLALDQVIIEFD